MDGSNRHSRADYIDFVLREQSLIKNFILIDPGKHPFRSQAINSNDKAVEKCFQENYFKYQNSHRPKEGNLSQNKNQQKTDRGV